jgi:hypothetical protein
MTALIALLAVAPSVSFVLAGTNRIVPQALRR